MVVILYRRRMNRTSILIWLPSFSISFRYLARWKSRLLWGVFDVRIERAADGADGKYFLRDLDRDSTRSDQDNSGCLQWQNAMVKFSGSVGKYLHNLISNSLLNESLQSALLLHLGVSPWTQDSNQSGRCRCILVHWPCWCRFCC
uniref:Putative secreted protein n=1 Tax=Anopheles darlingi TaxID=43151 RepID=A0A2M4DP91_ANODA